MKQLITYMFRTSLVASSLALLAPSVSQAQDPVTEPTPIVTQTPTPNTQVATTPQDATVEAVVTTVTTSIATTTATASSAQPTVVTLASATEKPIQHIMEGDKAPHKTEKQTVALDHDNAQKKTEVNANAYKQAQAMMAYQQFPGLNPEPFPVPTGFNLSQVNQMQSLAASLKVTAQAVTPISTMDYVPVLSTSINPNLSGMVTLDNQVDKLMYLPLLHYPQSYQDYRANLAFLYDYFHKFNAYANNAKYAFVIGNFYDPLTANGDNNSDATKNLKLSSMMAEVVNGDATDHEQAVTLNNPTTPTTSNQGTNNSKNVATLATPITTTATKQTTNTATYSDKQTNATGKINKTTTRVPTAPKPVAPTYLRPEVTYLFVTQNNQVTHTQVHTSNLTTDDAGKLYLKPQTSVIIGVLDLNGITNQSPLEIIIQNNSSTDAVPLTTSLTSYMTALLDKAISNHKGTDHTYTDVAKQEKLKLSPLQQSNYNVATKIVSTPQDQFLQSLSYSPQALDNLLENPNIEAKEEQASQALQAQQSRNQVPPIAENVTSNQVNTPLTATNKNSITTTKQDNKHLKVTTTAYNTNSLAIQGSGSQGVNISGGSIKAGSIHINAGTININNTQITADHSIDLHASKQIDVNKSQVSSPNTQATAPVIHDDGSLQAGKAHLHTTATNDNASSKDASTSDTATANSDSYTHADASGISYPIALDQVLAKPTVTGFIYPRMLGINRYFLDVLDHHDLIYKTRPVYPIELVIAVMDQLPYSIITKITSQDPNAFLAQKYHFVSKFPRDSYLATFRYNYLQTK